jgi:hypothetical protein
MKSIRTHLYLRKQSKENIYNRDQITYFTLQYIYNLCIIFKCIFIYINFYL